MNCCFSFLGSFGERGFIGGLKVLIGGDMLVALFPDILIKKTCSAGFFL